jgi:hypothetical protein
VHDAIALTKIASVKNMSILIILIMMPNEAVEKPQKHSPPQPLQHFFEESGRVSGHGCFGDVEVALANL